ncbi:head GIN domain-containing protein [uncultured Mucilaginibacter sp.]|uniref:head GIN domain-containing protein n=1 Tax=uncultured Mucilaginibacter sp. TaxID=797541 RepID=UPI002602A2F2|nr:head GIN domain-containing protein [uncultured Mucilaginibacter sp.]
MKKQPLLILSGFLLLFSVLSSCNDSCEKGSGKAASEYRKVGAFTKLNFSGAYKVVLKQGVPSVKVTADDNLLKQIETSVRGDELTIKTKKNICNAGTMEIDISNPDFQAVKTAGTIDLSADGKLNLKDFSMELAGMSKVNLNLNAANVTTSTSGSSEVNLTGQATSNKVTMSGKSNLNALDFVVANYRIETSGFTNCNVNVLNELSVNVSGAGSVQYKGNPAKISNEHSGATSIKKIE